MYRLILAATLVAAITAPLFAQAPAIDDISQKAAQLEAELGKVKDTTPEAAALLLQLVDLYHGDARVFGLISAAQKFVATHASHPRHKEVMLKLIDGLQATSRNKELTAACRQFLGRYSDDAAGGRVEELLAVTLDQLPDRAASAAAHEAVYRRQPNTPAGRRHSVRAVWQYGNLNNQQGFVKAAEVAEDMVAKVPPGEFVSHAGMQSVYWWQRASDWAKSNRVAGELLKKNLPADKEQLRQLHHIMAENYSRLGQRANAVESYRKARAISDTPYLHAQMIVEMYNGGAKVPELESIVNEYVQKYPDRQDRFVQRSYLANAWLRDGDKPRAVAILAELLPFDAITNANASVYVREAGTEPAPPPAGSPAPQGTPPATPQQAQAEQTLLGAIAKNEPHAYYLRYVLAFELYRDRMKDIAKARQTARDLISKSPTNDGHTQQAIHWLLSNPADDNEFRSDVDLVIKARRERIYWPAHRGYLPEWIRSARQNKNLKDRVAYAQQKLQAADDEAFYKDWILSESDNRPRAEAAREKLISELANLNDGQAWAVLYAQGHGYSSYGSNEQRARATTAFAQMAKRFPTNYDVAYWYLYHAATYSPPEVGKEAALHMLSLEPKRSDSNYEIYYRLMVAADRLKDKELTQRGFAWIQKATAQFGLEIRYADSIGDYLEKYEFKQEALDYWRKHIAVDRNNYYSRSCAERIASRLQGDDRKKFLMELLATPSDFHGTYAMWLAGDYLKAGDLDNFEKTVRASQAIWLERPFRNGGMEEYPVQQWVDQFRASMEAKEADKRRVWTLVRDLRMGRPSATAELCLLELPPLESEKRSPMARLLAYQAVTTAVGDDTTDWDRLIGYAQAAMTRKDYTAVATLASGMLSNIPSIDPGRQKAGRDMVAQSYARMGAVGLAIDESSPIAPLLQAALYLRLGDERLAFDTYLANKPLFDERRDELPVDLIRFVCESHIAAGGDENHDRAEDILRNWLVRFGEAKDLEDSVKAAVQLLLAKNYFKSQRYDVARAEYTTVINRYAGTPEATEAEFGIGESFMAQKVYDQAEAVFEKLAGSRERDVVIRAEFLRGVLANRRGDLDEAREIFRGVLEMVPSIELANQALFNLAEVYGSEQRYIDQLELLRTIGRLGRASKRWHTPGVDLSIVVQDSDLGISRGHARIPVRVITEPGGDEETIYLYSGGAGKGLFRADLQTQLGQVKKNDKVLQLTGNDTIRCDYPEEFKNEFRSVPLSDAEIRIAADGRLEVASSKIIDREKETFTERLAREEREQQEADQRVSQNRPINQIKPGNLVYLRVQDLDRDLSDEPDKVIVKLTATSGDQVQVPLLETGPHTGIFEGTCGTGELPAGALASDTAIDHNPLMAIDQDPKTYWLSAPDGATPKWLSVDMKDLRLVGRVTVSSPNARQHAPVRGYLEGSHDGRFYFRLASIPAQPPAPPVAGEFAAMTQRVYQGNYLNLTEWPQVVALTANGKPVEQGPIDLESGGPLAWSLAADHEDAKKAHAVVWHGKLVQPRSGAMRLSVQSTRSAIWVDGRLELPLGPGNRTVDVWLDRGTHDVAIFAAMAAAEGGAIATRAREDHNAAQVVLAPFRASDFDLSLPIAKPPLPRKEAAVTTDNGVWDFQFDPYELRHVRLNIQEYLGEAVAINHVEIRGEEESELHIPTKADVLGLAANEVLEIAAGDTLTASYTDEFTQIAAGRSQLLSANLTATYFNAGISSIAYDFVRRPNGQVDNLRKQLIRIDPGERFIVEVTDYDHDTTGEPDELEIQVAVNDGEPIKLIAKETGPYTGVFTKEVDTAGKPEPGQAQSGKPQPAKSEKLVVQRGDQIYCSFLDSQNTFPGHAVARESIVYVNQPSEGRIRVVETRVVRPQQPANAANPAPASTSPPQVVYLPAKEAKETAGVAFEAPLTVEVYDRDAAKDSRSSVVVTLTTSDGATVDVNCVISEAFTGQPGQPTAGLETWALEEGRFVGQVILQLGSKQSPVDVPLTASMPRNLVGGPKLEDEAPRAGEALVTRVLNLTGKDIVQAAYKDALRPDGKPQDLAAKGRLIANGVLACVDRDYEKPVAQLHVGEKMFLMVTDADGDVSDERDRVQVEITSERGEKETVSLEETLAHSGVFTGSVALKPAESPTVANLVADDPAIESYFGDLLTLRYVDKAASTETGELEQTVEVPVVIGTDGLVAAFSKTFNDETLAVETQFHIAESYFELFKSHKKLERQEDLTADLEAGRRVLREVMEDYPDPKYVPRIAYLLGQFAQELGQWHEAIDSYQMIVRQYPDHSLAADAQYKLAQCYEESNDFDQALEAYVTLAATYPKSPLIANVMIRISERFYRIENYEVAAQVGEKFLERFDGHEWASRMAFRVGQCYYKAKQYVKAAGAFDQFAKVFPDDPLAADALFWSGESFRMANNNPLAFQRYNRCRWDFPASDAAKYSRGRLALPAMLAEFERAANVEDN